MAQRLPVPSRMSLARDACAAAVQAGKVETLIDRLPGHPDGISRAADGGFYIAIVAPKQPVLQARVSGTATNLFIGICSEF